MGVLKVAAAPVKAAAKGGKSMAGNMAWGALAQGVTDIGQAFVNDRFRRKQNRFAESMAMNKYQWAARDLERAGLNRILAITQPQATGTTPGPVPPNFKGGYAQAAAAAMQARVASELLEAQKQTQQATAKKVSAEATTAANTAKASSWLDEQAHHLTNTMANQSLQSAENVSIADYNKQLLVKELQRVDADLATAKARADWYKTDVGSAFLKWKMGAEDALGPILDILESIWGYKRATRLPNQTNKQFNFRGSNTTNQ